MLNVILIPVLCCLRERCEVFEFSLIFRLTKRLPAGMSSTTASEAKAQCSDWLAATVGIFVLAIFYQFQQIYYQSQWVRAVKLKCFSAFLNMFLLQGQDRSYDSSKLTFSRIFVLKLFTLQHPLTSHLNSELLLCFYCCSKYLPISLAQAKSQYHVEEQLQRNSQD